MDAHDQAVSKIASQTGVFYSRKEPYRIYHGSTNSTRKSQYELDRLIDTSRLNHVLKVDTNNKTALVEPNVPMDDLVQATLQHGLVPPVVMEFPGITVGGGFAGTAGESSSFRYGFFDRTINWIEMVLANGEITKASRTENPDLFFGAASSFGTLGVTTLLEIQLVEAKRYVELTYHPVNGISEAQEVIHKVTKDTSFEYLDGIMYSKTRGIICAGKMTNTISDSNIQVQRFTRPYDPWFYIHVERLTRRSTSSIKEAIPLVDYLFRYDRGGFWVARYAYKYFLTPFNRMTRFLLDYFMHTRVMYLALHRSGLASSHIIQDVAIPYTGAAEFMEYLDQEFKQYPIWLCPLKQSGKNSTHSLQTNANRMMGQQLPDHALNFGVWGPGSTNRREFVYWNRAFEKKVRSLGGQKWLYAHTYYTEEEFNEIYDREEYDSLRKKYHATYLPSVYDKVKVDVESEEKEKRESWKIWLLAIFWGVWPLAGLYGVWKALLGGDYLLPRRRKGKKEV
ncbi:FAD-binding protein [Glarea lozoyensis ATCC 20868]|uniref:Delta(24)-sterol reductase n=1 Tax=Glarea lozoyensis (strain ATCC 20868 / MF5171) TaxID=1116229 RepID=S3DCQ7_GLAL2|nr:FAD-binding protein [Glarea lozoyensis ATCC 20868]EPE24478.1 FAD-binding protein [Glarea lozoyensis ATCC 20868]